MNVVNVGYDSTNYYILADSRPRLLVDVGFPGTLPKLEKQCKRMDIRLADIPYFLATHYHPDHAGLAEELKRVGCNLIVIEHQLAAIPAMAAYMKPEYHYLAVNLTDNTVISLDQSRAFLAQIGIHGEITATPGHSDDSVSLILDEGAAFTGDLPHPLLLPDDPDNPARQSWAKIRALGVKTVYPGHGSAMPIA